MTKQQVIKFLKTKPYLLAHAIGFDKLTELNNQWIVDMVFGKEDTTLQAHRGSYKTTCVSVALSIIILLYPNCKTMFMRKTDGDVTEIILQVQKILKTPHMQVLARCLYGTDIILTKENSSEVNTNLSMDIKGTSQLIGRGISSSLTGKHYDRIFTDDIINVQDRISKAERERTKTIYMELHNIKNRGGRIFNTGTPWHAEDAFTLMPNPTKYDCYSTGMISAEELEEIRESMTPSLFAANYELRHIASEDVIFKNPNKGADPQLAEQGIAHIDAAYGGEDYTAFSICKKTEGKYYIFGKMWHKHIDDCMDEVIELRKRFNAGKIYCEINADKGYLAKELRSRGERAVTYHEDMNKFLKITSYLKSEWKNIEFVEGTDEEYIQQICDYNENAEHDDAPDSCASIVRKLWKHKAKETEEQYIPLWAI